MDVAVEIPSTDDAVPRARNAGRRMDEPGVTNPYLLARRDWDERYGSLITRAKNWRVAAILCASIALVQTAGVVALSVRSKVVPYVVAVDSLGRQVAAGVVEESSAVDDRVKR